MEKQKLFKKDMPVIMLAFAIAFLVPSPMELGAINQHLAGIALGFGIAWVLKFFIDYKRIEKAEVQS
jgi:hypothetical protein